METGEVGLWLNSDLSRGDPALLLTPQQATFLGSRWTSAFEHPKRPCGGLFTACGTAPETALARCYILLYRRAGRAKERRYGISQ